MQFCSTVKDDPRHICFLCRPRVDDSGTYRPSENHRVERGGCASPRRSPRNIIKFVIVINIATLIVVSRPHGTSASYISSNYGTIYEGHRLIEPTMDPKTYISPYVYTSHEVLITINMYYQRVSLCSAGISSSIYQVDYF